MSGGPGRGPCSPLSSLSLLFPNSLFFTLHSSSILLLPLHQLLDLFNLAGSPGRQALEAVLRDQVGVLDADAVALGLVVPAGLDRDHHAGSEFLAVRARVVHGHAHVVTQPVAYREVLSVGVGPVGHSAVLEDLAGGLLEVVEGGPGLADSLRGFLGIQHALIVPAVEVAVYPGRR